MLQSVSNRESVARRFREYGDQPAATLALSTLLPRQYHSRPSHLLSISPTRNTEPSDAADSTDATRSQQAVSPYAPFAAASVSHAASASSKEKEFCRALGFIVLAGAATAGSAHYAHEISEAYTSLKQLLGLLVPAACLGGHFPQLLFKQLGRLAACIWKHTTKENVEKIKLLYDFTYALPKVIEKLIEKQRRLQGVA